MKTLISLTFIIIASTMSCNRANPVVNNKLRACPEKYFEDRMPPVMDPNNPGKMRRTYFIYRGQRRELSEFDTAWVWKNCDVEKQVVY